MNPGSVLVLIPAFNEERNIGSVVREVMDTLPGWPVLVADDGSEDGTASVARQAGAGVISLPVHLGLGGCVQAGYKLAFELGYEYVIRIDGDGQHDPQDIPAVLHALKTSQCEMIIGSRFIAGAGTRPTVARGIGIRFFRLMLRPILGRVVTDPTSGFVGVNHKALQLFSKSFPLEYPEIEALVVLQRRAFRFEEVPCKMRRRISGRSTIRSWKVLKYMVHVLLGVFVNVLRLDGKRRWFRRKEEQS